MEKSKDPDPIPAGFATIAEAAEFWDTHDLTDYEEQTQEVEATVKLERRSLSDRPTTARLHPDHLLPEGDEA